MKPVDVEPLSEQRWAKIEKEVFSELDRNDVAAPQALPPKGRSRAYGVVAACGVAAAALVFFFLSGPSAAPAMRRLVATSQPQLASLGSVQIELQPGAEAVVSGDDEHGVLVALQPGEFAFRVPSRGQRALVVQAGGVRLETRAASFKVSYLASETRVSVETGTLSATSPEGKIGMRAGDTVRIAVRNPSPSDPAPAAPAVRSTLSDAGVLSDGSVRSRGRHGHRRLRPPPVATAPEAQPLDAARDMYERAARIEGSRPEEAAALYFELAQGQGAWSENALFALGRLELERGQRERGQKTLQRYLSRYPAGRNAEDARRLLTP